MDAQIYPRRSVRDGRGFLTGRFPVIFHGGVGTMSL